MKRKTEQKLKNNKLIVVLGMHRSGTSAITRGLQVMGVDLGDRLIPPNEEVNAKGFWEDTDLVHFNIEILNVIGSDWHHLDPIEPIDVEILRKQGYLVRAAELLRQKVSHAAIFGFKDPRVAKLLPFWKVVFRHCQFDVSYVMAVRHPLSVVKSLAKRDGLEAEQSYLLWLGHVITSLSDSAGDKRVLVDYDRLMESPDRELMRIAKYTGMEIDPTELKSFNNEFLDQGLRHTVYDPNDLLLDDTCPPIVREVYAALLDVAFEKTKVDDVELQNKIECWSDEFERLKSILQLVDKLFAQRVVANQTLEERDGQIVNLDQVIVERDGQIAKINQVVVECDGQIANLNQAVKERNRQIANLNQAKVERDRQIANLSQAVAERDIKIASLISSNSWCLTKPLRFLGRVQRGELNTANSSLTGINLTNIASVIRQARATRYLLYIIRGDFEGLTNRIRERNQIIMVRKQQHAAIANIQTTSAKPRNQTCWGIMTTQHTLFIAHLIADRLREHGWKVDIMTEAPADFHHDWYVVICPQMFKKNPPGQKRIAFQMEQSVSSRWFTDAYIETLANSFAVLEYALVNIDFMASKGIAYPHVHYLPIGASADYGDSIRSSEKTCDILFYGDSKSSPRRREMLDALRHHFNVRVMSEVFDQDMLEGIKQARLVINLHYYENALLEMPRIQECLSLGVPVVSESAQDQEDYPELVGAVRFFEQGSIPAMLNAVKAELEDPVPTVRIAESVALSTQRFAFMFDRFLVAMNFLPASHVKHMSLPLPNSADRIALSMPETIGRRRIFEAERPTGCVVFDGIRRHPGWVGCGLSYMALAQHAMKQGRSRLNVMEDDVLLPPDFEVKMAVVHQFLDDRPGEWDVFVGVIASLHSDVKILSVEVFKDITFVTINKMTSMVFNMYGEKVLRLLDSWDPENLDAESNTIDRFLESQVDLRVVVTLPFFAGHREEVHSTLWGFQNTQYNDMIANCEQSLKSMVLAQHYIV